MPLDRLFVDEVWILDRGEPGVIPLTKNATQLGSRRSDAAGHDQRGSAEIDEANLAALIDSPTPAQVRGHARLASV
jgi:hypothetical protein